MVDTVGDATHPPFIQLKPPASGFALRIFELRIGFAGAQTNRARLRRTASPSTISGTVTTATLFHLDQVDTSTIQAVLSGGTTVAGFTEANSFWYDKTTIDTQAGYQETVILRPWSYPLIVSPGSALEYCSGDNSATQHARLYAVWDEIAV